MPRPKGSKNKTTLEREAQEKAAKEAASTVSTPKTESPKAKVTTPKTQPVKADAPKAVVKSEPLPEVTANAEYIIKMCDCIYKNLQPQQRTKWERGVGKNPPHYATPAHQMAATLISYFDLGIQKEETLQFFTKP